MTFVQTLVDRLAPPMQPGDQEVQPLLAKRFEQRLSELAPSERTAERLDRLFDEIVRSEIR